MKWSKTALSVLSIAVVGFLALGLATTLASATTSTTTVAVTANVVSDCTISTTPLGFGDYTGAVNNATSTFTITCSNGSGYSVGLDAGTTTGASVSSRLMAGPGAPTLSYTLYSDSGRTTNWGNTSGTWVTGTGIGSSQTITVYGQIPASQFVPVGAYSDSITATITY